MAARKPSRRARDFEIAELICLGASASEIASRARLSERMVRYIISGKKRPEVRRLVSDLEREFQKRETHRIMRAQAKALDTLVAAADATKFVRDAEGLREVADHDARIRAAMAIRADPKGVEQQEDGSSFLPAEVIIRAIHEARCGREDVRRPSRSLV